MPEIQPAVVELEEQPYVFIRGSVRMDSFAAIADRLGELIAWLTGQGIEFAGAPFFRFNSIDMEGESEVEAGLPVDSLPEPEGDIRVGMLPGAATRPSPMSATRTSCSTSSRRCGSGPGRKASSGT